MLDNDESQSLSYHEICVQIKKLVLFLCLGMLSVSWHAEAMAYSIKRAAFKRDELTKF